jgi:hypothetical protein
MLGGEHFSKGLESLNKNEDSSGDQSAHNYTDVVGKVYDLEGYGRCVVVRTITVDNKFMAEYYFGLVEDAKSDEIAVIAIMDRYDSEQVGGEGQLIEPNDYVREVDEWCFAENRMPGDVAIIENAYGYTICYISAIFN